MPAGRAKLYVPRQQAVTMVQRRFSTHLPAWARASLGRVAAAAMLRRVFPSRRSLACLLVLGMAWRAEAALLLTEIHYNGPASGADPDEFLELSNTGAHSLALGGYRFTAGVTLDLPLSAFLLPGESIILARRRDAFAVAFPGTPAQVLEFSGALSNAGELLTLADPYGAAVWSVAYDDSGDWPRSADGGGDSLQLRAGSSPLDAASWYADTPAPGVWDGSGGRIAPGTDGQHRVSAPPTLGLLAAVLPLLARRWRHRRCCQNQ